MGHQGAGVTREALKEYSPGGGLADRLHALPEHGCIYVKNHKAGCTTTLLWLHRVHTGDHAFDPPDNIHVDHTLPRPRQVGWGRVVRMLNGDAFRFTFVRDPIRRAESAYLDKVVRWRRYPGRIRLQRALGLPEGPEHDVTFEQFVAALEVTEPLRMDPHWRPQHLNLLHPLVEYDLVGRLETFDADLTKVREATGMPVVPVEPQHAMKRPADGLLEGRPDLRSRLEAIYGRDFELYGY